MFEWVVEQKAESFDRSVCFSLGLLVFLVVLAYAVGSVWVTS